MNTNIVYVLWLYYWNREYFNNYRLSLFTFIVSASLWPRFLPFLKKMGKSKSILWQSTLCHKCCQSSIKLALNLYSFHTCILLTKTPNRPFLKSAGSNSVLADMICNFPDASLTSFYGQWWRRSNYCHRSSHWYCLFMICFICHFND